MHNHAKDLFQLQTELVEAKVDMAVNQKIDRVIEQITDLKNEMHEEMRDLRYCIIDVDTNIGSRMIAVETKLGIVNETKGELRNRFFDYAFKTGWLILGGIFTFGLIHLH